MAAVVNNIVKLYPTQAATPGYVDVWLYPVPSGQIPPVPPYINTFATIYLVPVGIAPNPPRTIMTGIFV